ncbi:retrovirus-related pol polyprotein from transposon TNT 1-94, partial [Tanacetum coccineum]
VRVTKPQNKTPYELLFGHKPILSYIRPFGCHVTILNTLSPLGKFDGKSDEGFLVGYSVNSKAFRVYNLVTKRVEVNLHVNFLEEKPNVQGIGLELLTGKLKDISPSDDHGEEVFSDADDDEMPEIRIYDKSNEGRNVAVQAYNKYGFLVDLLMCLTVIGLQVKQNKGGIFISQDKYVAEILKKFDLRECQSAILPWRTSNSKGFLISMCQEDLQVFKGKPNLGIMTLSHGMYKKQTIVATSTTEAEYVAAANCCGQVLWVQNQLLDYGFNFMNTKIHIDNESMVAVLQCGTFLELQFWDYGGPSVRVHRGVCREVGSLGVCGGFPCAILVGAVVGVWGWVGGGSALAGLERGWMGGVAGRGWVRAWLSGCVGVWLEYGWVWAGLKRGGWGVVGGVRVMETTFDGRCWEGVMCDVRLGGGGGPLRWEQVCVCFGGGRRAVGEGVGPAARGQGLHTFLVFGALRAYVTSVKGGLQGVSLSALRTFGMARIFPCMYGITVLFHWPPIIYCVDRTHTKWRRVAEFKPTWFAVWRVCSGGASWGPFRWERALDSALPTWARMYIVNQVWLRVNGGPVGSGSVHHVGPQSRGHSSGGSGLPIARLWGNGSWGAACGRRRGGKGAALGVRGCWGLGLFGWGGELGRVWRAVLCPGGTGWGGGGAVPVGYGSLRSGGDLAPGLNCSPYTPPGWKFCVFRIRHPRVACSDSPLSVDNYNLHSPNRELCGTYPFHPHCLAVLTRKLGYVTGFTRMICVLWSLGSGFGLCVPPLGRLALRSGGSSRSSWDRLLGKIVLMSNAKYGWESLYVRCIRWRPLAMTGAVRLPCALFPKHLEANAELSKLHAWKLEKCRSLLYLGIGSGLMSNCGGRYLFAAMLAEYVAL